MKMKIKDHWKDAYRAQRMVNELNYDRDGDPVYRHEFTVSKHFQVALDYAIRPCEDKLNRHSPNRILHLQNRKRAPRSDRSQPWNCRCATRPLIDTGLMKP